MILRLTIVIFFLAGSSAILASDPEPDIIGASEGMKLYRIPLTNPTDSLEYDFYILKIDPDYYEFDLLAAIEIDSVPRTPSLWCSEFGYDLCFNAGMYAADEITPLGFCKSNGHILNSRINYHKAVLAFDPMNDSVPTVKIINRGCENLDSVENHYRSMVQSVRMLGCSGGNVWKQSNKRHSILAVATDSEGLVSVLFSQAPLSVYDFINNTNALDFGFDEMIYLEGSIPASLYVNTDDFRFSISGAAEDLWPLRISGSGLNRLPNVIAVRKKEGGK
ncbi:MAG: hypothetical protein GF310_05480 [candidate division Zixibacteria bacterium]|nr:hypothetical protein [candidate division Zixibacteria bacterium]